VFLLAGPSGVGKTETALALAEALFGGEPSVITINMSEFLRIPLASDRRFRRHLIACSENIRSPIPDT
jgi:DNA polymerase III delta prime subunit